MFAPFGSGDPSLWIEGFRVWEDVRIHMDIPAARGDRGPWRNFETVADQSLLRGDPGDSPRSAYGESKGLVDDCSKVWELF